MSKLFTPFDLSGLQLANRVVMAPMTRTRTPENIPSDLTALYYAQRASAGLIITEGLPVSDEGRGYLYTPGLYTDEQTEGWRKVTDAVHAKGGKIFAQLWHVGRLSHVSLQPGNVAPVSSGEVPATTTMVYAWVEPGKEGPVLPSKPRALTTDEVKRVIQDFASSARRAMDAGFDGVELMAANAFLFDQFLSSKLNTRTDQYGGSIENRQRLLLETIDALAADFGGRYASWFWRGLPQGLPGHADRRGRFHPGAGRDRACQRRTRSDRVWHQLHLQPRSGGADEEWLAAGGAGPLDVLRRHWRQGLYGLPDLRCRRQSRRNRLTNHRRTRALKMGF